MQDFPTLLWFRQDLRLADNPALNAAIKVGAPVIPVYVLDDASPHSAGAASRWWLHHSLGALSVDLQKAGARLVLRRGDPSEEILRLAKETGAKKVFWNRRYHHAAIEADKAVKASLQKNGVHVESFNGSLLREPWELKTATGGYYKVFTPFWKSLKQAGPARTDPAPRPSKIPSVDHWPNSDVLSDWTLAPASPNWASGFESEWRPGESGASAQLKAFLSGPADQYTQERDRADKASTSRLSPHLAFGEIGPTQIWSATHDAMARGAVSDEAGLKFLSEIAWREFSYTLLYFNPDLPTAPLREQFARYPWRDDESGLREWQKGLTGYPIVDAGMRQLWRTGWMHNRVRMIVASFLIKDLLIRWQDGEAWFWDTLVDADLANNSASWQWVAGSGADASPYFRIFNPVTQGEKFDPNGDYVREFVPELANMPAKHIHAPWKAPAEVLQHAKVTLGETYPEPIVDHGLARERALEGYKSIKSS